MILHHYNISPYSEKIRLMLGYAGIEWQSSIVPPMPPRPTLDPILGGYRRIPVAQVDADIFCDTRLIASEIALAAGMPELSYATASPEASAFATHTGEVVFMPIVRDAVPTTVLKSLITQYWPWQILALIKDRAKVGKHSKVPPLPRAERAQLVNDFKNELESKSSQSPFLFGESPCIADFAAYHLVWFADLTRPGKFLNGLRSAQDWQTRMQKMGHGQHSKINKTALFAAAKEAEPRAISRALKHHEDTGSRVTITPSDYAQDATSGTLVGADGERWIIARESKDFGTLHVHFPVHGYDLVVD